MQTMPPEPWSWWNELSRLGPLYANPAKTYLVVKEEHKENATSAFADTGVQITTEGKRHLGGSHRFTKEYVTGKVEEWTQEVEGLARVAVSQPQAAYAAFTHGLTSITYFEQSQTYKISSFL